MRAKAKQSEWESHIESIRKSAVALSQSIEADWNEMYECGMIDDIVTDCEKRWRNRGLSVATIHDITVFTALQAHSAWGHAIEWARDQVNDAI